MTSATGGLEGLLSPISSVAIDFDFTTRPPSGQRRAADDVRGRRRRRGRRPSARATPRRPVGQPLQHRWEVGEDLGLAGPGRARSPSASWRSARASARWPAKRSTATRTRPQHRVADRSGPAASQGGRRLADGRSAPGRGGRREVVGSQAAGPGGALGKWGRGRSPVVGGGGVRGPSSSATWRVPIGRAYGLGPGPQVHEARQSGRRCTSAARGVGERRELVVGHGHGHLGQLEAERAAEPAAALVGGPRHPVQPRWRRGRARGASPPPSSRRSGTSGARRPGWVGPPARAVAGHQLGELPGAVADGARRGHGIVVAHEPEQLRPEEADHGGARAGGDHDGLRAVDHRGLERRHRGPGDRAASAANPAFQAGCPQQVWPSGHATSQPAPEHPTWPPRPWRARRRLRRRWGTASLRSSPADRATPPSPRPLKRVRGTDRRLPRGAHPSPEPGGWAAGAELLEEQAGTTGSAGPVRRGAG